MITNHNLDSGIVRDVLAQLANSDLSDKYIGGGIGLQFFLPRELFRLTADIDLESSKRTNSSNYHDFVISLSQPLVERGYDLSFSKQRGTYDAHLSRDDYALILQIPRRSVKKFEELKGRLEREVANSEEVPYAGGKLKLINVNDLIVRKLGRADVFKREYDLRVPEFKTKDFIERANFLKENLDLANLDPREVARKVAYLRMLADVGDVLAVVENNGIDSRYIFESLRSYPTRDPKSLDNFGKLILN